MARLLGYLANQSDRIVCALTHERTALGADAPVMGDGWGVGSYQGAEPLLRKRPTDSREELQLLDMVKGLRASAALVHVRTATVGPRTIENTHPFRHRQWLFAHLGTLPDFATHRATLVARIPDLLSRSIAGQTDSEVIFHLFLAQIHAAGGLDNLELDRGRITEGLRQTLAILDETTGAAAMSLVVCTGTVMVALQRGIEVSFVRRNGIRDCAVCHKFKGPRVDHESLRYVIAASSEGDALRESAQPGWSAVPEASVVGVDKFLEAQVDVL